MTFALYIPGWFESQPKTHWPLPHFLRSFAPHVRKFCRGPSWPSWPSWPSSLDSPRLIQSFFLLKGSASFSLYFLYCISKRQKEKNGKNEKKGAHKKGLITPFMISKSPHWANFLSVFATRLIRELSIFRCQPFGMICPKRSLIEGSLWCQPIGFYLIKVRPSRPRCAASLSVSICQVCLLLQFLLREDLFGIYLQYDDLRVLIATSVFSVSVPETVTLEALFVPRPAFLYL